MNFPVVLNGTIRFSVLLATCLFAFLPACTQNKESLAESDSLFALGVELYNAGKYGEAIPLFIESDRIDKAELDSTSNRRDYSAMWLASCYYKAGDEAEAKVWNASYYMTEPVDRRLTVVSDSLSATGVRLYLEGNPEEALSCFLRCGEIEKSIAGGGLFHANTLDLVSMCYADLGDYAEAVNVETSALETRERILGKNNHDYAMSLHGLAYFNSCLGNYADAVRLGAEALEVNENLYGRDNPDYAFLLNEVASYNSLGGDYAEAVRLVTEALGILENLSGKESPEYAQALNNLALYNLNDGNYSEAIRIGTEVVSICGKVYGADGAGYAQTLSNLAEYHSSSGNYTEAVRLETEALEIRERVLGKEHPDYATSLYNLADYNSRLGNYTEAIRLGTEALEVREGLSGKENPDYAMSLSNLANYNSYSGNYSEAVRLGTEAMEIRERVLGKEHPDYAMSLCNLADYNSSAGNYSDAVNLASEALAICENAGGRETPDYAAILSNLANYDSYLGNYSEAIRLGTEALEIRERVLGKEHPDCAESLNNLAYYNAHLGNFAEAVRLETETVDIFGKTMGRNHPVCAKFLSNLAGYNSSSGNYSEAVRLCTEALEIYENTVGRDHPDYAISLNNLASYNSYLGNHTEAVQLGKEVSKIFETVSGREHPYYAVSLGNLAYYNFENESYSEVAGYSVTATKVQGKIIRSSFTDLTANERTLFWNKYKVWYESTLPKYAFYIQSDSLTAVTYDGTLMSKGLLLNSEMEMTKLIAESGDTAVIAKYRELKSNRALFNKMVENRYADLQAIADTVARMEYKTQLDAKIDSLERRLQMRERELVQESKAYGDYTRNLAIDWRQVREKLTDRDAAIEFLSFPVRNDSVMYAALTLTRDDDVPHMTTLFEKSELDSLPKDGYYGTPELSNLVWKPLAEVIEGKENIYFAPAGELHNIAIESLPCYDGGGDGNEDGLVSDRWNLYRLSSTRELALAKDKTEVKDAYLYGDLKYDTDIGTLVADAGRHGGINRDLDWETVNIADTLTSRGMIPSMLSSLPATKEEVESIDRTLKNRNINSALLTDTLGTETSLKALSGKRPGVLHIATHGFYWTESEAKNMNLGLLASLGNDTQAKYTEDMALTRSGLCFAGAEQTLKHQKLPEGVDDGILTAKEISVLDLRGLDLVVLSACKTGLGEITGDGVFGLQRGFKKAGAQTLLMSLWKVDDAATKLLMTEFYGNLAKGEGKFAALKEAQKTVRTFGGGEYSDPKYWAAFILLDAID